MANGFLDYSVLKEDKHYALAKNNPPSKIFLTELYATGRPLNGWWSYNGWAYNVSSKQLYTKWPPHKKNYEQN